MPIIKHAVDIKNKTVVENGFMVAYSGHVINLFDPDPETLLLTDIAHGLAFNCRWNGATKTYFSVAEHCIMMHEQATEKNKATALFHDCEEAYWGDVIRPLKNMFPQYMRDAMDLIKKRIFEKFGIPPEGEETERLDTEALEWEFNNLILQNTFSAFSFTPPAAEQFWLRKAENATRART